MAIEIVDLPINSMVIFHSFLYVYQMIQMVYQTGPSISTKRTTNWTHIT